MERTVDRAPVDRELIAELIGAAVDAVPHPFGITDYETILFVNSHACTLQGVETPEQLIGQPVAKFAHPDMLDPMAQRAPIIMETRQALRDVPTKYIIADGAVVSRVSHLIPIEFDGRTCVLWVDKGTAPSPPHPTIRIGSVADSGRLALVFEALPDPMLVHDEREILAANAACRHLLGAASSEDIVGLPVESIVHPDGHAAGAARRGLIARGRFDELNGVEVKLVRLDGRQVRIRVDAHVIGTNGRRAFLVTARMA